VEEEQDGYDGDAGLSTEQDQRHRMEEVGIDDKANDLEVMTAQDPHESTSLMKQHVPFLC